MKRINVLDQVTVDKIAAGEVVERPVSVVKELVENSIDAGAGQITLEIEDGGITGIRITDNGGGIIADDVRKAFLRHSTSKIHDENDLEGIMTLGFRGEALSSIAAVAQVELVTRTADEEYGVTYKINGGREMSMQETGTPVGTIFDVRQLFYNTPARRKFLKTPMTEASHIGDLVTRLALSHPEIGFRFVNNGQKKLQTAGNGSLKDVIYNLYGREIAAAVLPVDYSAEGVRITGFAGEPSISRGNRSYETFFINGRYIKSNLISKAIEDAYKGFTMQHRYPFVVLMIELDARRVDVNVHPTKMEVRFLKTQEIYNYIYEALDLALHQDELIPEVEPPQAPAAEKASSAAASQASPASAAAKAAPDAPEERVIGKMISSTASRQPEMPGHEYPTPEAQTAAALPKLERPAVPPASERNLDFYMAEMKQRVESYHAENQAVNQTAETERRVESYHAGNSSAEVKEQSQIFKPEVQMDRIKEHLSKVKEAGTAGAYAAPPLPEMSGTALPSAGASAPAPEATPVRKKKDDGQLNMFAEKLLDPNKKSEYRIIGQLFDTYWLLQFQENLYIIDQHAAHEKVLYERTMKDLKNREYTTQQLSPPIILNLSMKESQLLEQHMASFRRIGFEIEDFGPDSYAVRGVPDNLFSIAKQDLLLEMIDALSLDYDQKATDEMIDEKIASMSCKAAVKGNMTLSQAEAEQLIDELMGLENPYNCPHGRPTIIAMTKKELEKKFKRIV